MNSRTEVERRSRKAIQRKNEMLMNEGKDEEWREGRKTEGGEKGDKIG